MDPASPHPAEPAPGRCRDDDPARIRHELEVHQAELAQQNEQLQETRDEMARSLQRYVELYDDAPVGLVTVDDQGRVRNANPLAEALLGRARDALLGQPLWAALTPHSAHELRRLVARCSGQDRRATGLVEPANAPAGGRQLRLDACRSQSHPDEVLLAFADVTEAVRADSELARTRRSLEMCNRAASIGVWALDPDSGVVEWSPMAREIHGVGPDVTPGRTVIEASFPEGPDRDRVAAALDEVIAAGRAFDLEGPLVDASGRRVWVRLIGMAEWSEGRCQRVYGTIQDVDLRQRAEQARLAQAVAEAANRSKSVFLARVSHELRTPLNAVLGFSHVLQRSPLLAGADRERGQLRHIHDAGQHLLSLIDDILDISRAESGQLALQCEPFDLVPLIDECIAVVQLAAQHRHQSVKGEQLPAHGVAYGVATGVAPGMALGDRTRMRQVLINLLSNAVKYTDDGGSIRVRLRCSDHQVSVAVADSGPGLAPEQQEHLFEPFNRLGAERGGVPGTGLGLVIVRTLLEAMGGSIAVQSGRGVGSVFTATLPRALEPPAGARPSPLVGLPPDAAAAGVDARARPATVLYVEDNAINVEVMRHILSERTDLTLAVAADGLLGLQAAQQLRPDLVLLDMHMPGLDGSELRRRLAADPDLAATPCVAISANAMAADIQQALDDGFIDYLTKPVDVPRLLALIDRVLHRHPPLAHP